MNIEKSLYDYLASIVSVTNLLQKNSTNPVRIFPDVAPTSAERPYVTFQIISDTPQHHKGGAAGLTSLLLQTDVWASSSPSRRAVTDALTNALDGLRQTRVGEITVRSMTLENRAASFEEPTNDSQQGTYRMRMDWRIWHDEDVPALG